MDERKRSDKWISGILAFLIPGLGHFYLGQFVRGLVIMAALIVDMTLIIFVTLSMHLWLPISIPLVVLLSLLLPVIYFFNIFDALQTAERKYRRGREVDLSPGGNEENWSEVLDDHSPTTEMPVRGLRRLTGKILIGLGIFLLVMMVLPSGVQFWLLSHFEILFAILLLLLGGWLIWKQWDGGKEERL